MIAADDAPEPPDPLLNPDGTRKKDLRYTEDERHNVRVERQLDGSGHLARGDKTHMSVLNFSARAQPRTERDPDFAFRPPPAARPTPEERTAPSPAADHPAAAANPPAEAAAPTAGSLVGKIKRILGF